MKVETSNKNINVNRIVSKKKESFILEEDIIIPDVKPDILNTINTIGNVCIYKKEVLDGKIRLDGEVNVFLQLNINSAISGVIVLCSLTCL